MAEPPTVPPTTQPTMPEPHTVPPTTQPAMPEPQTVPPTTQPAMPEPQTETAPPTQPAVKAAYAKSSGVSSGYDMLLYFVALFVPPVPVLLKRGFGAEFCINILLWIFGWIPGVIHSWYIISKGQRV